MYPYDVQQCHLKFGSWTYNGEEINVTSFESHMILDNLLSNGEWEVGSEKAPRTQSPISFYLICCKSGKIRVNMKHR